MSPSASNDPATMKVALIDKNSDLTEVAKVLNELRPQFELDDLIEQLRTMMTPSGYQLACVMLGQKVLSVAGFQFGYKLAWGSYLYIDDFVTTANHRSQGAGKLLMSWLKEYALQQGCEQLHLDSGVHRFEAHRFYLREGFLIASHHFSIMNLASKHPE